MKGRVIFAVRVYEGQEEQFRKAYDAIRATLPDTKGHIKDQLCQSPDDPRSWCITSEWESVDIFWQWEKSEDHRQLVKPMIDCFEERKVSTYNIVLETPE